MAQGRMAELTDILTDWLTVEEAAVFAGVDVKTILAWIKTGKVRVLPLRARDGDGSLMRG